MNGRRAQLPGLLLVGLAAAACSSPPLYPSNSGGNGETTLRGAGSNGGSSVGSTGDSGSSGGSSAGETTTGGSTNGKPPGCQSPCNLPGQFCDDAGQCVVCLGDEQCHSTLQPHCFNDAGPYFGTCVGCLASDECPLGHICDTSQNCVPGCGTTNDCTSPTMCEGDSGMCVTCLSAAQCTNGLVCFQGACGLCSNDYQCFQNYGDLRICGPEENCVQCQIDLDCAAGQHCVGFHCQ